MVTKSKSLTRSTRCAADGLTGPGNGAVRAPLCALLVAACLLAPACAKKEEPEPEPIVPVQVAPARQDTISRIVRADAVLYPYDQATVMPKISAPVANFTVRRGDHVKAGQLLAVLENRDLLAAVAESKGQLAQAEANYRSVSGASLPEELMKAEADVQANTEQLSAAQKLLQSRMELFKQGALARKQVDEAQVQYVQAKSQLATATEHLRALKSVGREAQTQTAAAQVEAAKAHVQSTEAQLGYSRILSPITGVISDRPLYPGEMASTGAPLLTVMDLSRIVARANIPQNQAALLKVGGSATITVADSGLELPAKVTVVSPATDAATTTVQVWVEAANPGERLKPGTSVQVSIVAATIPNAVVVPAAAILPAEEGGTALAVVGPDSVTQLRTVQVGVRQPDKAQILSGVKPGEQVVVSGGVGLQNKAKVRIVQPGEKAGKDADAGESGSGGKDEKK